MAPAVSVPGELPSSAIILDRMAQLHPKMIDLSLDRISGLLEKMGNPHLRLPPVIHVAGTNGKGSTVAFMRAILEAAGLRVHVYTSPHLQRFHERIRLAGDLISESDLCARLLECERVNAGAPITFFEITTVAAFCAFAQTPADIVLLEVGMGGRLDTTNVITQAAVTVITPVDLDHQRYLGDTLGEIAGEKAGILKPGAPAIIGPQKTPALDVIMDRASAIGAPLLVCGQDWLSYVEHGRMVFQYEGGILDLPLPALLGQHQISNAGAAIAAVLALENFQISSDAITAGLMAVEWPARLQRLRGAALCGGLPAGAELWLDGGHNPAAAVALASALANLEERHSLPLFLICGMLATKDARNFFTPFAGLARAVYTIAIPNEANSMSAEALASAAREAGMTAFPVGDLNQALMQVAALSAAPSRIVICGSLYLAGKVLDANAA